jgi:hypothetical protein
MLFWSSLLGHARLTLLCCAQRGSKASQGISWKEAQENRGGTTLYTQQQVRRRVFLRPSLSPRLCFYFSRHMMASENCCCTMILRPPSTEAEGINERRLPRSLPSTGWLTFGHQRTLCVCFHDAEDEFRVYITAETLIGQEG